MTVASFSPLVLDQFQLLFSASDDVERLNRTILQLAVQGKIVEQNPKDEPAKVLLSKVFVEKESSSSVDKHNPIREEEKLFQLPNGWEWVRLLEVCRLQTGKKDVNQGNPKGKYPFFTCANKPLWSDEYSFEGSSLILPGNGANVGMAWLFNGKFEAYQRTYVLSDFSINEKYLYYVFLGLWENHLKGKQAGSAINYIKLGNFEKFVLPIPPLAEQERIVAHVEELLAQTRQLADKLARNEQELTLLNQSALAHLLASQTPEEFERHWNFIAEHFDSLFTEPEHVSPLRQSILELAVRGKLTRREAGDESASELLKHIKEEQEKNGKTESLPIKESEKAFDLPDGWQWARLTTIADVGTGSTPLRSNPDYFLNGTISWVTSSATNSPFISKSDELITEKAVRDTRLRLYPKHTLIVALYGQGKTRGQVSELLIEATTNQACASLVFNGEAEHLRTYTKIFLIKNYREMRLLAEGGAQPNLNLNKIKQMLIPIPPLAEQERIVAKVEQLLSLCDALESRLWEAREARGRLVESVLVGVGG